MGSMLGTRRKRTSVCREDDLIYDLHLFSIERIEYFNVCVCVNRGEFPTDNRN